MGMQQETHANEYVSLLNRSRRANCHLGLINVDKNVPAYDGVSGLHRPPIPVPERITRITLYHNEHIGKLLLEASFGDYGDHWFITRPYALETLLPARDPLPKRKLSSAI
jgi:hypothetical protein